MIGLVHLVWAPLGPEPLREFVRSYRAHDPGAEHELVIVLNSPSAPAAAGAEGATAASAARAAGERETLLSELDGVEHRLIALEQPVLDLAAYGLAARELTHGRLCFLNSYSVILTDDWLARLERALEEPRAGIAGASGSWESQAEWVRGKARYWPLQLARLPGARRDYPRFPNPHVRTTAFIAERDQILDLRLEGAHDKRDTYLLESGHDSITSRIRARGRRALVAGRDGEVYDVEDWPRAHTYRSGEQRNLIVADKRTSDWEFASPRLRRRLSRDAWGDEYV
jgi:hypothetical protein